MTIVEWLVRPINMVFCTFVFSPRKQVSCVDRCVVLENNITMRGNRCTVGIYRGGFLCDITMRKKNRVFQTHDSPTPKRSIATSPTFRLLHWIYICALPYTRYLRCSRSLFLRILFYRKFLNAKRV
jgi:hypothetical protein